MALTFMSSTYTCTAWQHGGYLVKNISISFREKLPSTATCIDMLEDANPFPQEE